MKISLAQLSSLSCAEFVSLVGPVFEHSPWIAEAAWARQPFRTVAELHEVMGDIIHSAGEENQLALIRAHPDLVGRLARAGQLTPESTREQASAGLDQLTPVEVAEFQSNNTAYLGKFGFPFVICARLNQKAAILSAFQSRLNHSREQEIRTALAEIFKIAELRLNDLVQA